MIRRGFRDGGAAEDNVNIAPQNVKLFLREPLGRETFNEAVRFQFRQAVAKAPP